MKPCLVEESVIGDIPPHLEILLQSLRKQQDDAVTYHDAMVVVVFVLMLETGFSPWQSAGDVQNCGHDFNMAKLRSVTSMPQDWRLADTVTYRLRFTLHPFLDCSIQLDAAKPINNSLCVTLTAQNKDKVTLATTTTSFHPALYVTDQKPPSTPLAFAFLKEFSIDFKDRVSLPVKNAILRGEDVMHASIEGIPPEIKRTIFRYMPCDSLIMLSMTCKVMNDCMQEQKLWKDMFQKEFGHKPSMANLKKKDSETNEVDWKETFIRCRKRQEYFLRVIARQRAGSDTISSDSLEVVFYDADDGYNDID